MEGKLKQILLIEDDPITNFINTHLIKKLDKDIRVNVAVNGKEGLSFIKCCLDQSQAVPQLILLDINMPVMNGFEFLEEFQNTPLAKDVVIVMLTTSNHLRDMDRLFKSGNLDLISKPLTEEKFKYILMKYFEDRNGLGKIA